MKRSTLCLALAASLAALSPFATQAAEVSAADLQALLKKLEAQQKQIDELKKQIEATTQVVETREAESSAAPKTATTIGGYGELHYANYEQKPADLDFHRFVLFFGHKFSDKLRFHSELEIEHSLAGEGKPGEVELEQAFVEYLVSPTLAWKSGLFLVPVGLLNETHEPPTFYGVDRNRIETDIVPSTWWEGGTALSWKFAEGWSSDFALTSGLKVKNDFKIRGGRQKVANAISEDLAYTARVKYTGIAGLEVGLSVQHQDDIGQGAFGDVQADLLEVHAAWTRGAFGLRALYAAWDIDHASAKKLGRDEQTGWFVEPSWKLNADWGVFFRHSVWDTEAGTAIDSEREAQNFGVNLWLHPHVVLKADWERQSGKKDDSGARFNDKGLNLGVGYHF